MPNTTEPDPARAPEQQQPAEPIPESQLATDPPPPTPVTTNPESNHNHHPGGPNTPQGKEISSNNATTHGGTTQKLFVAGENPDEFHALYNSLLAEHNPTTDSAKNLIHDFALAQWFLWRRIRACNSVEHSLYESEPDPALWPESSFRRLTLMERYRTTAERSFQRALANLDHLKYANVSNERFHQRQQNTEARLAHDKERLALQTQRLELTKSLEEAKQTEKDDAAYQDACGDDLVPTLHQEIVVREGESGETLTDFFPPNKILRLVIERAAFRPDFVHRHFRFLDGVPQEYWWDDEESEAHADRPDHTIDQQLSTSDWLRNADDEDDEPNGLALPADFDDDDEDQEYEDDDREADNEHEDCDADEPASQDTEPEAA